MKKLTITIVGATQAIVVDEAGKSYEAVASFHARTLGGEYKYHEVYVYLNKIEAFKGEFKAPKTLKQKWYYNPETGKFKGPKLMNYTETLGGSSRTIWNFGEMQFED